VRSLVFGRMEELLRRLAFVDDDMGEVLRADPRPHAVLEERRAELVTAIGGDDRLEPWPYDPSQPWLHAWTLLAALPDTRAYHAARGVADGVSWATLADLGRCAAIDRRLHGSGGLRDSPWLVRHFRGRLYELGRLQFEEHGGELLVHIPESGPLDPAACDDSFARAREFFAVRQASCTSWLLDPALAEYLDADSNIVRFQRRFELVAEGWECDADVIRFVFRRLDAHPDDLPQRTTLERAVVAHIRSGAGWRCPTGRLSL
jgi:GNAT domain-containint protein/N-acyltransferase family protein